MTFKLIQCNEYPHTRKFVVHRGVVVPPSPTEIGDNYALALNSDANFPDVKVEGEATSKTAP